MDQTEQRRRRGWIDTAELSAYENSPLSDLLAQLTDDRAYMRTIAARLLPLSSKTIDPLLETLACESALYTRLAITDKLESGDRSTVEKMLPLLATIGKNQHQTPIAPSKKNSYPLPRDLIARSLGRMDPALFPVLLEAGTNLSISKLKEWIDAIGYMVFYHPDLASAENFQTLYSIKEAHLDEPLIQWKFLICFSAFPQSKGCLLKEEYFVAEAQRSLNLLAKKMSRSSIDRGY